MTNVIEIAAQFVNKGSVKEVKKIGNGNINKTFLVLTDKAIEPKFVLQQINTQVFTQPHLVMDNIQVFTEFAEYKISTLKNQLFNNWQMPKILFARDNKHHYIDEDNNFWRAISFIENTQFYDTVEDIEIAKELGLGLGIFHFLISDLDTTKLADTLPGFHITPNYLQEYNQAIVNTKIAPTNELNYCQNFIEERLDIVRVLEAAKEKGILKIRPIHGDPKVNNIAIDKTNKKAIAMIDLDTIKPGLIHYDIGDCLRSGCNKLGEETKQWQQVNFDLDIANNILQGYLSIARNFMQKEELDYVYDAIRLISFELGLRFFTDYLNKNIYFKTEYPQQNLQRALVQFQLTNSIELQERELRNLIS